LRLARAEGNEGYFGGLSTLTDEELDAALDASREMLAARAGEAANAD
jgi:hypothetical protein